MDQNTLSIYIHELRTQCLHTEAAFNLFNQSLNNQAGPGVLFASLMILKPAAQISSILWPTRARARGRGEQLRKVLQLNEKHPLNDRRLAEIWERADEKLDEWIAQTKGNKILVDFVGDHSQLEGDPTEDENIFRAYNTNTRTFYYRGVGYSFQSLADAISDVSGRVNAIYRQLFPELAAADDKARAEAVQAQEKAQQDAAAAEAASAPAPAESKPAAKKAAPKKAAAKKPADKKAPAKKSPAKKPAAKKAPAKKAAAKK